MRVRIAALGPLLVLASFALSSCASAPTQGVGIASGECQGDPNILPIHQCLSGSRLLITPNIPVWGNEFSDYYSNGNDETEGTVGYFGNNGDPPAVTGTKGILVVNNGEAPAYWDVTWLEPWQCGTNTDPSDGPVYEGPVEYGGDTFFEYESDNALIENYYPNSEAYTFSCINYAPLNPASKRLVVQGDAPSSITLGSSAPLTVDQGMPLLYVYNEAGSMVTTETATTVSSDGTQATFPFPSTLPSSGYSLAIVNQSGMTPAGDNLLAIASSQTITGNPFGVAAAGQTVRTTTTIMCPRHSPAITSSYNTHPVISLYSANEVYIDGTYVNVGPNPTAVAAYAGPIVTTTDDEDCIDLTSTASGMTRGLVANSGGNTVTMLDLVNRQALTNITVGNQPVALAVSSDASTAYVANYSDSTVTRIALNSGNATTTVAVGGQPTSLALTSGGILWVGGVGFLSEINTSTMQVVATESTGGRTIIGLGYSDAEGQLAATTVDSAGSVYADQVNPASVVAGGSYQPAASTQVSTVPQHLNTRTNSEVLSFTATLASSPVLNIDQPGAPPMVVQDGWAVVTVTPTGFTISNIENGEVLASENTPSPVTGVAVDPTLAAAYLVMPDSNTLLTVPLPGVAPAVPSQ